MLQSRPDDRRFESINDEARHNLDQICSNSAFKPFRRGSVIKLHSDQVWIISQGLIQLGSLYPNGEESLLGIIGPTMPFGLPLTKVDPYNATALTDVVLVSKTMSQIQESPALQRLINQQSTYRLRQTEAILAMLGYRRIEDRLRQFLILIAGEIGETTPTGIRLGVRLTHQMIANATGTTRVTATRLLGALKQEGWLTIDRQHHIILTRSASI